MTVELAGACCRSLVGRLFEPSGEVVDSPACIFVGTERGVFMLYLDDEDYTWKVESTDDDPSPRDVLGDAEFRWSHLDLGARFDVIGEPIEGFSEHDAGTGAVARLCFASGRVLELGYHYESEEATMRFLQIGAA